MEEVRSGLGLHITQQLLCLIYIYIYLVLNFTDERHIDNDKRHFGFGCYVLYGMPELLPRCK